MSTVTHQREREREIKKEEREKKTGGRKIKENRGRCGCGVIWKGVVRKMKSFR